MGPANGSRRWLVTGCSSGMGRALVKVIAEHGERVVATARRLEAIESLVRLGPGQVAVAELDVVAPETIAAAVAHAVGAFDGIDLVVNCAGVGQVGSVEETSPEEFRRVFETNVFGTHNVLQATLPHLRAQRHGLIAGITSQGAFQGQPACAVYCASKAALMGIYEGLAEELAPLGIAVTMIEAGLVRSGFRALIAPAATRIADYDVSCNYLRDALARDMSPAAHDTMLAARAIYAGLTSEPPPRHLPLGADALAMIRRKLEFVATELNTWEELALSVRPPASAAAGTPAYPR